MWSSLPWVLFFYSLNRFSTRPLCSTGGLHFRGWPLGRTEEALAGPQLPERHREVKGPVQSQFSATRTRRSRLPPGFNSTSGHRLDGPRVGVNDGEQEEYGHNHGRGSRKGASAAQPTPLHEKPRAGGRHTASHQREATAATDPGQHARQRPRSPRDPGTSSALPPPLSSGWHSPHTLCHCLSSP